MKLLRTASVLVLSAFALTACDDDATGVEIADLAGLWNATQFEYSDNANPSFSLDAVADAGGEVTLDVSESGSFSGTLMIPGLTVDPSSGETITLPIGGTLAVDGENLTVNFNDTTLSYQIFGNFVATFTLEGDVLTFVNDDTSFDFPDSIEEQAGLGARGAVAATLTTRFTR